MKNRDLYILTNKKRVNTRAKCITC